MSLAYLKIYFLHCALIENQSHFCILLMTKYCFLALFLFGGFCSILLHSLFNVSEHKKIFNMTHLHFFNACPFNLEQTTVPVQLY
jgi:hypothetical protein